MPTRVQISITISLERPTEARKLWQIWGQRTLICLIPGISVVHGWLRTIRGIHRRVPFRTLIVDTVRRPGFDVEDVCGHGDGRPQERRESSQTGFSWSFDDPDEQDVRADAKINIEVLRDGLRRPQGELGRGRRGWGGADPVVAAADRIRQEELREEEDRQEEEAGL